MHRRTINTEAISDTVEYRHQSITGPTVTPADRILHGIYTLTNALTDASSAVHDAQLNAIIALGDACQSWARHSKPGPQQHVRQPSPPHTLKPTQHKPTPPPPRQSPRVHTTPSPPIPPQPVQRVEQIMAPDMSSPRVPKEPPQKVPITPPMEAPIATRTHSHAPVHAPIKTFPIRP